MAECTNPGCDSDGTVTVPAWTNSQDLDSHQSRISIIRKITETESLDGLRAILDSDWDINEVLNKYDYDYCKWEYRTAMHEAARRGWTEGMKMLLDAGVKHKTSDSLQNILVLALENPNCPAEIIELLLTHGADPNDHDYQYSNIPLIMIIGNYRGGESDTSMLQLLLEHGANPNVACTVDSGYCKTKRVRTTALHEAAWRGWTEGVKVLLDAGAKCDTSDGQNVLTLAIQSRDYPAGLIDLLLTHGADPNDHDDQVGNIPLLAAILCLRQNNTTIVDLLLQHGANPNVTYQENIGDESGEEKWEQYTALNLAGMSGSTKLVKMFIDATYITPGILANTLLLALHRFSQCPSDMIELFIKQGADVNHKVAGKWPLVHHLSQYSFESHHRFPQQLLHLFFLHGGNIDIDDGSCRTAIECAVKHDPVLHDGVSSNSVRWLIRHGADTSRIRFTWLKDYFLKSSPGHYSPEIPLILLQTGMRVSHGAVAQLRNMQMTISALLQDDIDGERRISRTIYNMWDQLEEAEEEESQSMQSNLKKSTFPEYCTRQMVDLPEFSDESVYVYPDDIYRDWLPYDIRREYQNMLNLIRIVLEFLSQSMTLQWYCHRCVRENLVSLQPSVVKTLPIPARLKRYVLCHEI